MRRSLLSALLVLSLFVFAFVFAPAAHAAPQTDTSCKVTYTVSSDFHTGFIAIIFITNTGSAPINGWTLQFAFAGNQQITSFFNGQETQTGQNVTIVNQSYNGTIAPGQTVGSGGAFPGFVASYSGVNTNPTAFTLNGQQCSLG